MGARERVLSAIQERSLCDDCLSTISGVTSRQTINQVARDLQAVGRLRRGDGTCAQCAKMKIVNRAVHGATTPSVAIAEPTTAVVKPTRAVAVAAVLTEDDLKRLLVRHLEQNGWSCEVAWGMEHGADVLAKRGTERWIIEAKGGGSLPPMRVNYFIGVLGEALRRMTSPDAKYSIAVPEHPQFRGLWDRLPPEAKRRTKITALFVAPDGSVQEAG